MPTPDRKSLLILLLVFGMPARAALVEVNIEGVDGAEQANVRAHLSIVEVLDDETVPYSQIAYLHRQATQEIRAALAPYGYYRISVESRLNETDAGMVAHYVIDPGPPVTITELNIGLAGPGRDDAALREAVADFPLSTGAVLVHQAYESGKADIQALLNARGYFDAELTRHAVRVNPDALSAVIDLQWNTGPRFRLGEVRFEGGQFPPDFLRRFVPFESGAFYSQDKLLALQRKLLDTAWFEHVGVDVQPETARDATMPVVVTLVPDDRDRYTLGFTYGTDSGARIEAGFERRWLNDRGHSFRVNMGLGERRSDLNLQYAIPVQRRDVREYVFGATLLDETTESVERKTAKANVSRVGRWGPWDQIVSLNALREEFTLGRVTERTTVLYPELRLSRTVANDVLIPTRGWSLETYARGGAEAVISDTSFAQLSVRARYILPAFGRDRVLLRADAATTWASDFGQLPASLRYFAGGAQSVRGFAYEELGPTDAEGEVIGGKHLLVGSVEYEHMFTETWGMAAFVDAGNAFSGSDFDVEYGAGLGVRWRSPIGTVRVDVASALSRDDSIMVHLVIGPFL